MLRSRTLAAPFLMLLLVVACSSPAASTGGNGGNGSEQSQAGEPTQQATSSDGGGGTAGDAEAAFEILTPPNATQTTKTSSQGVIFAAFESSDSIDSLKSFYEGAIPEAGLQIVSTTEAQGGFAWAVSKDASSNFGGAVSIFPSGTGSTAVTVTIGQGN